MSMALAQELRRGTGPYREVQELSIEQAIDRAIKILQPQYITSSGERLYTYSERHREIATEFLGFYGAPYGETILTSNVRFELYQRVLGFGRSAVVGSSRESRELILETAVSPLIESLKDDPSSGVRYNAALSLGNIGSVKAIPPLIESLKDDPSSGVRYNSAFSLGNIGSDTAIPSLIEALKNDPDSSVRTIVALALGNIGSEAAVPPLIEALKDDPASRVRVNAASALGEIGSETAVTALVTILQNSDSERLPSRYQIISSLRHRSHLRKIDNSSNLVNILLDLSLQTEDEQLIRYGAFVLLASTNNSEARKSFDINKSEFLELIETHAQAWSLPFQIPEEPLSSEKPSDPFGPTIVAYNINSSANLPFQVLQQPIIPSYIQGADPGETREALTARLDGKPPICLVPWVDQNWKRCRG